VAVGKPTTRLLAVDGLPMGSTINDQELSVP
jgi:hypothetical protein